MYKASCRTNRTLLISGGWSLCKVSWLYTICSLVQDEEKLLRTLPADDQLSCAQLGRREPVRCIPPTLHHARCIAFHGQSRQGQQKLSWNQRNSWCGSWWSVPVTCKKDNLSHLEEIEGRQSAARPGKGLENCIFKSADAIFKYKNKRSSVMLHYTN